MGSREEEGRQGVAIRIHMEGESSEDIMKGRKLPFHQACRDGFPLFSIPLSVPILKVPVLKASVRIECRSFSHTVPS